MFSVRLPFNRVLKRLGGEVIDHWVKATVGYGNAKCNWIYCPDHCLRGAACNNLTSDQCVEDQIDVVRNEAKTENEQVHNNHTQYLSLVQLPSTVDALCVS